MIASIFCIFIEKIDRNNLKFTYDKKDFERQLHLNFNINNLINFSKLKNKIGVLIDQYTKQHFLPQEWTEKTDINRYYLRLESIYLQQIDRQDIDMTFFLKKVREVPLSANPSFGPKVIKLEVDQYACKLIGSPS